MPKDFHVVCEGITDFEVIRAILKPLEVPAKEKLKAVALFPRSKHENAGWGNLKSWCQNQESSLAGNMQRAAAASALGAKPTAVVVSSGDKIEMALRLTTAGTRKFLVVQIDTDIAEHLAADIGLKGQAICPLNPASREKICELALDRWLGQHVQKKGTTLRYCITSLALENWILATHTVCELNAIGCSAKATQYDHVHFPDQALVKLGYTADKNGKLIKNAARYVQYGSRIASVLPAARMRSRILDSFCSWVVAV